jgi:hypothetical protein
LRVSLPFMAIRPCLNGLFITNLVEAAAAK